MEVSEMETIQLDLDQNTSLNVAQERARSAVSKNEDGLRLIAWYDGNRETGGPSVACKGEVPKCVRDYASSLGSEHRVWVNDGRFEFFFSSTGKDVEELDREWALRVHDEAELGEHDNVQGG